MKIAKVLYEVRDRVGYITLNRPEKRNAIDKEMAEGLFAAFNDVRINPEVWVCLIAANGPDFSTGHDLMCTNFEIGSGKSTEDLYDYLMHVWKPTVVTINGHCLAQGAGIACCCDIRFAADNAKLGWPQSKRGIPSTSGPAILSRMIPYNIAMELLYTGEFLTAADAFKLKLINRIYPAEKLMDETEKFIRTKIMPNAPLAMRIMKEVAIRGRDMTIQDQVRFAGAARAKIETGHDIQEGIAAFFEKREPKFEGIS